MREVNAEIATLVAQGENTLQILQQNCKFYHEFSKNEFILLGKTIPSAMILSQIFVDYYTCVETFLFRVSQTFENNLRKDSWHKDLLEKMSLNIPNIRPAVLSHESANILMDLLQFRHFRRYYFNFDYDWDKITLIENKYKAAETVLIKDIEIFLSDLRSV